MKAREWGERIPMGILFREERPTYTDQLRGLSDGALVDMRYDPDRLRKALDEL